MPSRTDRAEARALLAAFETRETRGAFEEWLAQVDAWERKLDVWSHEYDLNGPRELEPDDAEPERSAERVARSALGDAVSSEVVSRA
jgi:hypothetical protein